MEFGFSPLGKIYNTVWAFQKIEEHQEQYLMRSWEKSLPNQVVIVLPNHERRQEKKEI